VGSADPPNVIRAGPTAATGGLVSSAATDLTSSPLSVPATGDVVALESGARGRVGALLGQGGQGAVFAVTVDGDDRDLALKWYFPRNASAQQESSLRELIDRGSPHEHFLWPLDLAWPEASGRAGGFGYVMRRRPDRYKGLVELVAGRVDVPFRILAMIGIQLAHGFLALHNEGLCYRDISFGNVFFDPDSGDVLICDNDNVGIDGESVSSVRGTPYFMAPEIVVGVAMPSRNTDLWSLAVLLFYLLIVHHPLEGRRSLEYQWWDDAAMQDLFGTRPLFIFDRTDRVNEPVEGYHDNALILWPLYPAFLRDLFHQAFEQGIADPVEGRVRESVWRAALARLRDAVVYCPGCGRQNLYDEGVEARACWSCEIELQPPLRLRFGRQFVVLNHDTQLFAHHLRRDYDLEHAIAQVARHPDDDSVWGLRNLGTVEWRATAPDREPFVVEPGRSATLVAGLEIDFGTTRAVVEN
jgi:DNA-binding helix-hairpin-helix protein with protein kinase domain